MDTYIVVNHSVASADVTYNFDGWHLGKINKAWFIIKGKRQKFRHENVPCIDDTVKLWLLPRPIFKVDLFTLKWFMYFDEIKLFLVENKL